MNPTTCTNCGTRQGPFVRDRDLPRHPVCGLRRGKPEDRAQRIRECLARREAVG